MTDTQIATPVRRVVDGYFAMWNEREPVRRRRIIKETWIEGGSYVEPLMAVEGHDALDAGVASMQAQFPGHHLRPAGRMDTHHDRVRWDWELIGPEDREPLAAGTNVAILAPDGRLGQVTGFFDHTRGMSQDR